MTPWDDHLSHVRNAQSPRALAPLRVQGTIPLWACDCLSLGASFVCWGRQDSCGIAQSVLSKTHSQFVTASVHTYLIPFCLSADRLPGTHTGNDYILLQSAQELGVRESLSDVREEALLHIGLFGC